MNQLSFRVKRTLTNLAGIGLETLAVVALLCCFWLLTGNMSSNEVDLLPLARQYVDPTWIPGDWYLNQPPGYRMLFQALFGRLTVTWGFLATSVIGRLLCYCLVATGLVLIGRKLGLSLPLLLLSVSLFLDPIDYRNLTARALFLEGLRTKWIAYSLIFLAIGLILVSKRLRLGLPLPLLLIAVGLFLLPSNTGQSVAAGEWMVGGFEAKAVAYGLVTLAIGLMLGGYYRWTALILGLATSFHVLVGGYAFLSTMVCVVLRQKISRPNNRELGLIFLLYIVSSALAIGSVLEKLLAPNPEGDLLPSQIYVFLRLPHHLNPLSWSSDWQTATFAYLLILLLSSSAIWLNRSSEKFSEQYAASAEIFKFTLVSLVPFVLGLIVAPFDSQGRFLQYYPFRLGDVMLPLNSCLLLTCALNQTFTGRWRRLILLTLCIALLSWSLKIQTVRFTNQLSALQKFPGIEANVDAQWKDLCTWIRNNTPQNSTIISSPGLNTESFSWLTERPTIAKFKLMAQTKAGILAWYERLNDLSGESFPRPNTMDGEYSVWRDIAKPLAESYSRLKTDQIERLMDKYGAEYITTQLNHRLDLPVAYSNRAYVLYKRTE